MTREISLFPIGTVVVLRESTAAVMITGYLAESDQKPGYTWDYSGFLYPIGLRDERQVYTFDHTQIEQVLAIGYQDGESFAFLKQLKLVAAKLAEQEDLQRDGEQEQEITSEIEDSDQ